MSAGGAPPTAPGSPAGPSADQPSVPATPPAGPLTPGMFLIAAVGVAFVVGLLVGGIVISCGLAVVLLVVGLLWSHARARTEETDIITYMFGSDPLAQHVAAERQAAIERQSSGLGSGALLNAGAGLLLVGIILVIIGILVIAMGQSALGRNCYGVVQEGEDPSYYQDEFQRCLMDKMNAPAWIGAGFAVVWLSVAFIIAGVALVAFHYARAANRTAAASAARDRPPGGGMFCSNCGAKLAGAGRFCQRCGMKAGS